MYIREGIVYADDPKPVIKICGVRPLADYKIWLRFTTGEAKVFDFKPFLSKPAFEPLKDEKVFKSVYIDYGITVWNDGDIDIAPEFLYENSISAGDDRIALKKAKEHTSVGEFIRH